MNLEPIKSFCFFLVLCGMWCGELLAAEIVCTSIIPHSIEASMRYRRARDTKLAAREQLFVKGPVTATRFDGRTPAELLRQLHLNAGHFDQVGGYTDNLALYDRYPIKLFNRLWPLEKWDTDEWLPKIHAVEFMGEPMARIGREIRMLEPYLLAGDGASSTVADPRWLWKSLNQSKEMNSNSSKNEPQP